MSAYRDPFAAAALSFALLGCQTSHAIVREPCGISADGAPVESFTLTNSMGMRARLITLGATLVELWVPDRRGHLGDVVLGFADAAAYQTNPAYFGCTIGRVCNRIGKASFSLGDKDYRLTANDGDNSLHGGGAWALSRVVWRALPVTRSEGPAVRFSYTSPDGEEGYPGNLEVAVTYVLGNDGALRLEYEAAADQATPVNLTHHSYFNLRGEGAGDVFGHELQLFASSYTPADAALVPTGAIAAVEGTPFDFRAPTAIGARLAQVSGGYDLNYVLDRVSSAALSVAAVVHEPRSGRILTLSTTEPGLQFYSGNFLDGKLVGKSGAGYARHAGFCLEPQHFPDSVHRPQFPSVILRPGEKYRQVSVYAFAVK